MAKIADQAERYEDLVEFIKEIIQETSEDVSIYVKNLLSVDYKNLISSQRPDLKSTQRNKAYSFIVFVKLQKALFSILFHYSVEKSVHSNSSSSISSSS